MVRLVGVEVKKGARLRVQGGLLGARADMGNRPACGGVAPVITLRPVAAGVKGRARAVGGPGGLTGA